MCERFVDIATSLRQVVGELEPGLYCGDDAASLVSVCSEIEHLGAAAKALFAKRAVECRAFQREGDRSAADWLARKTGENLHSARDLLEATEGLGELAEIGEAFRSGELSQAQLSALTDAASGDPSSQKELLFAARGKTLRSLRQACLEKKAARRTEEEREAAYEALREGRSLRHWTDRDGAFCFTGRSTPDDGARLVALLDQETKKVLDEARREGRREPVEAYRLDALMNLLGGSGSTLREVVVCRINGSGLFTGDQADESTCEVPGFGPVPLHKARELMGDAILDIVVTEGTDIRTVVSNTRHRPRPLDVALKERDGVCCRPGCESRLGLEAHHILEFSPNRITSYDVLARLCGVHHDEITYGGARLAGRPGAWEWVPAPGPAGPPPGEDDDPFPPAPRRSAERDPAMAGAPAGGAARDGPAP